MLDQSARNTEREKNGNQSPGNIPMVQKLLMSMESRRRQVDKLHASTSRRWIRCHQRTDLLMDFCYSPPWPETPSPMDRIAVAVASKLPVYRTLTYGPICLFIVRFSTKPEDSERDIYASIQPGCDLCGIQILPRFFFHDKNENGSVCESASIIDLGWLRTDGRWNQEYVHLGV